jgi:hypothetical protein
MLAIDHILLSPQKRSLAPNLANGGIKNGTNWGRGPKARNIQISYCGVQLTILGKIDHPIMQPSEEELFSRAVPNKPF